MPREFPLEQCTSMDTCKTLRESVTRWSVEPELQRTNTRQRIYAVSHYNASYYEAEVIIWRG